MLFYFKEVNLISAWGEVYKKWTNVLSLHYQFISHAILNKLQDKHSFILLS